MREIKFRAWSNEYKEMYYRDFDDQVMPENAALFTSELNKNGELFVGHYLENGDFESLELMQYTGLKDKNGKEIYESDIVEYDNGTKAKVIFKNGCFCGYDGYATSSDEAYTSLCTEEAPFDGFDFELEVIGNIHENPKLLQH